MAIFIIFFCCSSIVKQFHQISLVGPVKASVVQATQEQAQEGPAPRGRE